MSGLANHLRIRGIDGQSLDEAVELPVRGWPLHLIAELSESAQVQLTGIGVICEPETLSAGTTTVVVRMCEEAVSEELAIECCELTGGDTTAVGDAWRFRLRLDDKSSPVRFPKTSRLLMHEVAQNVEFSELWKKSTSVVAMRDERGQATAVPLYQQEGPSNSGDYMFEGPGWSIRWPGPCAVRTTSKGELHLMWNAYPEKSVFLSYSGGSLRVQPIQQGQKQQLDSSMPPHSQWLDLVASGPRLALTDDSIMSVSETGTAVSRWPLPQSPGKPVAAAQISPTDILVLTKDCIGYVISIAASEPTVVTVGRVYGKINGRPAVLIREQPQPEDTSCSGDRFTFRSAGVCGPCWSTIKLAPHPILSAGDLEIPFEVSNVVRMLRFLGDNKNADQQSQQQTLKDFARRELKRFGCWFLPSLAENLHRTDLSLACRHFSLDLLQELNSPEIIDDLLYLAFCGENEFSRRAVESLLRYRCEKGFGALGKVIREHQDVSLRLLALDGMNLAEQGLDSDVLSVAASNVVFDTLLDAVTDRNTEIRLRTLKCLTQLKRVRQQRDRRALEAIYQGMAEYADTSAAFATAIMQCTESCGAI
jgi:hypothetical protein